MRLKGKTALISGAGRNIGKSIALTFAREGADLILLARERSESLNEVARECASLGVNALLLLADVGKHEEVNRVVQLGLERFGKVDVLANVAALRPHNLPWEITYEQWHEVFAVNLHSLFYFTKALVPGMIKRGAGGSIMALGGMAAMTASNPTTGATVASKHGLHGFIKSLARALGPHGIRANMINPGTVETERAHPEWYPSGTAQTSSVLAATPMGRFAHAQEVANIALFLASDESSYTTGDCIGCTGGQHL